MAMKLEMFLISMLAIVPEMVLGESGCHSKIYIRIILEFETYASIS